MKRLTLLLLALLLPVCGSALGEGQAFHIATRNNNNITQLLIDLLNAYEQPREDDRIRIRADLETIRQVREEDYVLMQQIAEHWLYIYTDPDFELRLYRPQAEEKAEELKGTAIADSQSHAFVVLGYELQNGEMGDELRGRCDAAFAAASAFPNTLIVCSGGATGSNNPRRHTEGGVMRDYLKGLGIDPVRILTDEKAKSTAQNAVNTFKILKTRDVKTMTLVTSAYHLRWGQVLYHAMTLLYQYQYGYCPEIVENFCFETQPTDSTFLQDARFAVRQLAVILDLPAKCMQRIPPIVY